MKEAAFVMAHIRRILVALERSNVPAVHLAYRVTESQWRDMVAEMEAITLNANDLSYAESFVYMGVEILKPKSLCDSG